VNNALLRLWAVFRFSACKWRRQHACGAIWRWHRQYLDVNEHPSVGNPPANRRIAAVLAGHRTDDEADAYLGVRFISRLDVSAVILS